MEITSSVSEGSILFKIKLKEMLDNDNCNFRRSLLKMLDCIVPCSANPVITDTLHLNPADSWLDLLKTWAEESLTLGVKLT